MAVTPLLMSFHNHQPVGNFPWVFEECYRTAYEPFLALLERHPGARVALHFTGALLDWLEVERPEYVRRVRRLVEAGQVEVLGGGLYEPILSVIPERDRLGQLRGLRQRVMQDFGQAPRGAWLAERVWEPTLPAVLHACGVHYVLVDDEAWAQLGYREQDTWTSYLTEEQGATVRLLPISRRLRYTLPTRPVDEVLETLCGMARDGAQVLIYAEDGERYGNWPGTFTYLYGEEAYLERLFTALEEARELRMMLPGEFVARTPPRGRCYLPPSSYTEMQQWSGGFWRNFLVRYRESNLMHKKMYQVSRWVAQAEDAGHDVQAAQRDLYAAQCNCAYWYGAFGGLYLPPLRHAVYQHLLTAERAVAPLLPAGARPPCDVSDHDCDGQDEVFLRDAALSVGIAPAQGGAVFALEHLPTAHNFLAAMARYPLRDEQGDLPVDWHPRFAFLDHLLTGDVSAEAMRDERYHDAGDFVLERYTLLSTKSGEVVLRRNGHLFTGSEAVPLQLEKRYALRDGTLQVSYCVKNASSRAQDFRLAVEMNSCLTAADAAGRSLHVYTGTGDLPAALAATAEIAGAEGFRYQDAWLGAQLSVCWNIPTDLLVYPISTPLRTLEGLEWVYQSTVTLPVWHISLPPLASWRITIGVEVEVMVQPEVKNARMAGTPG